MQEEKRERSDSSDDDIAAKFLRNQEIYRQQLEKHHEKGESKYTEKSKTEKVKSEKIFIYFCAICGKKAIMANVGIDTLPNRRSDNSIAINMKQVFLQSFLTPEGIKYIKRPVSNWNSKETIEKQYRLKCNECGVFVAYQCISYEESVQILTISDSQLSNKPYLYVLNDALVINQQFAQLYKEAARLKDQLVTT